MEPAERLRQLRAQHRLVADHLAWIEGEIARAETGDEPTPIVAKVEPDPSPTILKSPLDGLPDRPPSSTTAQTQRLGCILATVLGAAIALFLFWGLPYVLYKD